MWGVIVKVLLTTLNSKYVHTILLEKQNYERNLEMEKDFKKISIFLIFNLSISAVTILLYIFLSNVLPWQLTADYGNGIGVDFLISIIVVPAILMIQLKGKYSIILNLIFYYILGGLLFKDDGRSFILVSKWFQVFGFTIISVPLQKIIYLIIKHMRKEDEPAINLKKISIFWLKVMIIVASIVAIYFAVLFVQSKGAESSYNKQIMALKEDSEIVFEFNKNKVYVNIDDMKVSIVMEYGAMPTREGFATVREYKAENSTIEEFNTKNQSSEEIVELYNEEDKVVYGIKYKYNYERGYNDIFMIVYKNEYFIVKI